MSWVSTRTRLCKRDAAPSLLIGLLSLTGMGGGWVGRVVGGLRGEEGEQGLSLRLLLAHQMTANTWRECRVKKKVIVAI